MRQPSVHGKRRTENESKEGEQTEQTNILTFHSLLSCIIEETRKMHKNNKNRTGKYRIHVDMHELKRKIEEGEVKGGGWKENKRLERRQKGIERRDKKLEGRNKGLD